MAAVTHPHSPQIACANDALQLNTLWLIGYWVAQVGASFVAALIARATALVGTLCPPTAVPRFPFVFRQLA